MDLISLLPLEISIVWPSSHKGIHPTLAVILLKLRCSEVDANNECFQADANHGL